MKSKIMPEFFITEDDKDMSVVILCGSLKDNKNDSNTYSLSKIVKEAYENKGCYTDIYYLKDYTIGYGVEFENDLDGDQFDLIKEAIDGADIVLFATPIWWGIQSSLIQKVMERMSGYDDYYIESGESLLYGKIFGILMTGFQSIMGNLYKFAAEMGFVCPPESYAYWQTIDGKDIKSDKNVNQSTKSLVSTTTFFAESTRIKKSKGSKGGYTVSDN